MKDPASSVRMAVAPLLGEPGDKATHKFLVQALHDPNPEVRRTGAEAGRQIDAEDDRLSGRPVETESIKDALRALTALMNNRAYRDKTCVKELMACLTDRSPEVRIMAIHLLARIGPDTLPMLDKLAAEDVDEDVRQTAKQVLAPPPP